MLLSQTVTSSLLVTLLLCTFCAEGIPTRHLPHHPYPAQYDDSFCNDPDYMNTALHMLASSKFAGLLGDVKGQTRFEASGVANTADGGLAVVFDDISTLAMLGDNRIHELISPKNIFVPLQDDANLLDSQYEGIVLDPSTGHHFVIRETFETPEGRLYPSVLEISFSPGDTSYTILNECLLNFEVESTSKGFEGLEILPTRDGDGVLLLGLCESNYCKAGQEGDEKGNGRIIAATLSASPFKDSKGNVLAECSWEPTKEIIVPDKAFFEDYSDMAFVPGPNGEASSQLSIVSQVESCVFVAGFDVDVLEFTDNGEVFHFPRNDRCEVKFCNVEGILWIDDVRFVAVSDKAKDDQPFFCLEGDQSASIFALPP